VVVLLFEASLLASETSAWSAFAAAAACGRWAALPLAAFLPAARAEGTALSNLSISSVALGLLAACAVAVGVRGLEGLAAVGAAVATALVLGLFFRRWLGGVTGDTLGATSELAQAAALAALLVA
jgi:adenosylcobinamide-GDP ribazoletransferase